MVVGSAPPSTSHAIRATRVVVLPDPAGATHSTGPGGAVAAARWSGVNRSRRCRTDWWATATSVAKEPLPATQLPLVRRPLGDPSQRTGTEGGRDHAPDGPIGPWRHAVSARRFIPRRARRRVDSGQALGEPSAMHHRPLRRAAALSLGALLAFAGTASADAALRGRRCHDARSSTGRGTWAMSAPAVRSRRTCASSSCAPVCSTSTRTSPSSSTGRAAARCRSVARSSA